jgi:phosphodiesterase/alkaline phosphatase D-like protein
MKSLLISTLVIAALACVAVAQTSSNPYGSSPNQSATAAAITNGPVAETVSDSNAFIGWSTRDPEHSTSIRYGTKRDRMEETAQATENTDGKNHHARLQGLSPDTTYYFQVMANGQPQGGIGTFKTVGPGQQPMQSKATISQK